MTHAGESRNGEGVRNRDWREDEEWVLNSVQGRPT
jgi:hypothetical protein